MKGKQMDTDQREDDEIKEAKYNTAEQRGKGRGGETQKGQGKTHTHTQNEQKRQTGVGRRKRRTICRLKKYSVEIMRKVETATIEVDKYKDHKKMRKYN